MLGTTSSLNALNPSRPTHSGAHLNPAVSLSFCVLGDLPWRCLLPYSLSQVLGAYLASAVVYTMYYGEAKGTTELEFYPKTTDLPLLDR